jgi:RNA polymerase sigma factor (sigma-70 family)
MITINSMSPEIPSDADLVKETLGGNRDAFCRIVERYQTLLCSLAYSATGDLGRSQDLAQESFVAAWKDLRVLREPHKLRAWLCTIVRNRVQKNWRREGREPLHNAESLDGINEASASEPLPSDQAVSRDEEAIMWRSLARIPTLYREPLVLFYREHQSIQKVAEALELSEDAAKQRLSRGRKLLQEEVQAFVENTLLRSAPSPTLTGQILAALPSAGAPAAAAAGLKGTATAKSGLLGAWLIPFAGIFAGVVAQGLIIRATTADQAIRQTKIRAMVVTWGLLIGFALGGELAVHFLARHFFWSDRTHLLALVVFWSGYAVIIATASSRLVRTMMAGRRLDNASAGIWRTVPPMKPAVLGMVVAGTHLALFSWLIRVAWRADDLRGAALIAAAMVTLGLLVYSRLRNQQPKTIGLVVSTHLGLCLAVILMIFNLQFDLWMTSSYSITADQLHHLVPGWLVPLLSVGLLCWSGLVARQFNRHPV